MRDEMGAQRVLQVIKNQLERIKWFPINKLHYFINHFSYRICCGANECLLHQTIRQIVHISTDSPWQHLKTGRGAN